MWVQIAFVKPLNEVCKNTNIEIQCSRLSCDEKNAVCTTFRCPSFDSFFIRTTNPERNLTECSERVKQICTWKVYHAAEYKRNLRSPISTHLQKLSSEVSRKHLVSSTVSVNDSQKLNEKCAFKKTSKIAAPLL